MFDAEHKQRNSPATAISFSSSALRCEQPLEGFTNSQARFGY
jgi:hypothetical protein